MKRKGSGRTKGAGSFVAVNLDELNRVLKPEAIVIVSRRYSEQLQLAAKGFIATTENIQAAAQQIQFDVSELEDKNNNENEEIEEVQITETSW